MIRPANPFLSRVTSTAYSVLASPSSDMPNSMHRPIPAPEPNPEPNPAPDAAWPNDHANIAPADWDQLFHAVQARLEDCVSDSLLRTPGLALRDKQAVTKTTVLECVEALKQLHAALTLERQQRQAHHAHQALQQ